MDHSSGLVFRRPPAALRRRAVVYFYAAVLIYARLRKVREGGGIGAPIYQRRARLRLPMFPTLGGAGPLVWRQSTRAIRSSRSLLFIVLIAGIPLYIVGQRGGEEIAVSLGTLVLWGALSSP